MFDRKKIYFYFNSLKKLTLFQYLRTQPGGPESRMRGPIFRTQFAVCAAVQWAGAKRSRPEKPTAQSGRLL